MHITDVRGVEIRDSRGNPTIEVFISSGDVTASFQVPSGASTGASEAYELRDEDTQGMNKVISVIEEIIKPKLLSMSVFDQKKIDDVLLALDGTEHKTSLGGNTMIGVSIACAKCAARLQGIELYEYLRNLSPCGIEGKEAPYLYVNLINGGKHSHSNLAFQEYHIVPETKDVNEALSITDKVIDELEKIIIRNGFSSEKGDEGGYALATPDIYLPLQFLEEAVRDAGFEGRVKYALDVAATSFYNKDIGSYEIAGNQYTSVELQSIYKELCSRYAMVSIEDPFHEDAFTDFSLFQPDVFPTFFVGDDLTTTNLGRLKKAHEEKSICGLIVKPNQIGTLSETIAAIMYAHENDIKCIVSHRSGETMDTFIADLAVAYGCFGIKSGSPRALERAVKYNRLLEITS